jgi:hypothetical protein
MEHDPWSRAYGEGIRKNQRAVRIVRINIAVGECL